jgi:hypothetical protein
MKLSRLIEAVKTPVRKKVRTRKTKKIKILASQNLAKDVVL